MQNSNNSLIKTLCFQEFVSCEHWFHMDIAGVADNADEVAYLPKGMSGRPTRTLAEFLRKVHAQDSA